MRRPSSLIAPRSRPLLLAAAVVGAVALGLLGPGAAIGKTARGKRITTTTKRRNGATTVKARPTTTTTIPAVPVTVPILGGAASVRRQGLGAVDLTRLPLGTNKYGSSAAPGSVYRCPAPSGPPTPNDGVVLPWINGSTFDLVHKVAVAGSVPWSGGAFAATPQGAMRVLAGNDLPPHTTGVFPVAVSDQAYKYRPNPSAIAANGFSVSVPLNPSVAAAPSCLGGEIGVTLNGIELFNAFDADGRDAVAEETQDHCEGHPNVFGYHYHSISNCLADPGSGHSQLLGYAFDGFGIFGHRGEGGKVLTNADLDECHGHTHAITWDGKTTVLYHYHATWEFPYVIGCFRGTSTVRSPAFGTGGEGPRR